MPIEGRAYTDKDKRAIIERLYHAWISAPGLRFGQLISNVTDNLFYVEDEVLAERAETLVKSLPYGLNK